MELISKYLLPDEQQLPEGVERVAVPIRNNLFFRRVFVEPVLPLLVVATHLKHAADYVISMYIIMALRVLPSTHTHTPD